MSIRKPQQEQLSPAYAIFAGLSASLVAIGLARFAYTPLIPALIEAHWFAANDVVYLGAANFVGYFAGALSARRLATRWSMRRMLQLMMALASLSFAACALPLSLLWFFAWRLLSGFAGAVVMVLVAQTILPLVEPARRGFASGAIFMGIGAGIVASSTLVPLLLRVGLDVTWMGLAFCSSILTILTWRAWPRHEHEHGHDHLHNAGHAPAYRKISTSSAMPRSVQLLFASYSAVAVGLVPAAVFLVDYVARGLMQGGTGAIYWVLYGLGALGGPVAYGFIADHVGFGRALRLGLALAGAAALLLALTPNRVSLVGASLLLGAFTPGVVTLMIGRLQELMPHDASARHAAWGHATTLFALLQALAGFSASYLFARNGGRHAQLFLASAVAFALALIFESASARVAEHRNRQAGQKAF